MSKILRFSTFFFFMIHTNGQNEEGDGCINRITGAEGVCLNIRSCQTALNDIRNKRGNPQLCSFTNVDPIVCCMDSLKRTTTQAPVTTTTTTTTSPLTSSTAYVPEEEVYVLVNNAAPLTDQCEPIAANSTAPPNGQKAWDKCLEYQEKLVYPCKKSVALTRQKARSYLCKHDVKKLIVGGIGATKDEFPHMALLGYGEPKSDQWLCGGTLISERFVLTAGHCTFKSKLGQITYVRLGAHKRTEPLNMERIYRVKSIIKHPKYKPPSKYHDIALIETERNMILDEFSVPACLDTSAPNDYENALASGWGATTNKGATADQLQKVILRKFSAAECADVFPPHRLLEFGYDKKTQICYGDKNVSKDTCQGDSGGPLQLKHKQFICMYTVIGVTSYGKTCGATDKPGMYIRVAHYVPWIESIVWS